jgi:hypothetical protein
MTQSSNMYADAKSWNPAMGCRFGCVYCVPTFQAQAKRQKQRCHRCYDFVPHCHQDRLSRPLPSARIIFVCGYSDISFCPVSFVRSPHRTYYFQSKRPACFEPFLREFPGNVILLTTLETNRDSGYGLVSQAPPPSERYQQFKALDYPRKVFTLEPIMDFDPFTFARWIIELSPEYVWLGFNSRPLSVTLPEPSPEKLRKFMTQLVDGGIEIRGKNLRGLG